MPLAGCCCCFMCIQVCLFVCFILILFRVGHSTDMCSLLKVNLQHSSVYSSTISWKKTKKATEETSKIIKKRKYPCKAKESHGKSARGTNNHCMSTIGEVATHNLLMAKYRFSLEPGPTLVDMVTTGFARRHHINKGWAWFEAKYRLYTDLFVDM